MSTKVIGWVVGIVIVGGIVWYGVGHKGVSQNSNAGTNTASTQSTTSTDNAGPKTSLAKLILAGGNQKCTFVQDITAGQTPTHSEGTVYLSSGRVRGDFKTAVTDGAAKGQTLEAHMIQDAGFVYTWATTPASTQGIKSPVPDLAKLSPTDKANSGYVQELNYNCSAWTVDASVFTLPTTVTFKTIAQVEAQTPSK